ncbi:uncharacterized protein LOC126549058 [Aphis gossypii]|uniref:uncharacterized protein LOC126549058 n=1 Tax=Aphis gossypii TaxID=80765 RepID=UPI002158BD63|nr:uncharacterized protein LOC126549058 [Aphis gossypii]
MIVKYLNIKSQIIYFYIFLECNANLATVGFVYATQFANFNVAMQYRIQVNGDQIFKDHVSEVFENYDNEDSIYRASQIPLSNIKTYIFTFYTSIIGNNIDTFEAMVLTPSQFCIKERSSYEFIWKV